MHHLLPADACKWWLNANLPVQGLCSLPSMILMTTLLFPGASLRKLSTTAGSLHP